MLPDRAADGVLLDQSASMEPVRAQADAWAEEAKRDEHTTVLPFAAPDEAGAIASDGTDIAAAIDEAASRFAGPGGRRIILISDGVQTQGRRADCGAGRGHRRVFGSTRCR